MVGVAVVYCIVVAITRVVVGITIIAVVIPSAFSTRVGIVTVGVSGDFDLSLLLYIKDFVR